jgi:hypothetical protein
MNAKQRPFAMSTTEDTDRVPPAHGTTHADESLQGFGGFVSG